MAKAAKPAPKATKKPLTQKLADVKASPMAKATKAPKGAKATKPMTKMGKAAKPTAKPAPKATKKP